MLNIFSFLIPKSKQIIEKGEYHNGVARVKCKDGRYNFINEKGRFLFKEGFHKADEFTGTHTIAGCQLINIHGEIRHFTKIEKLDNHEGIFAVWHHDYSAHQDRCAFMNNMGELLTTFSYSYYKLRPDGTIYASYSSKKYSSPLGLIVKPEESWYTILDSMLKEITPRLGQERIRINDSLQICYTYPKNGSKRICLYNTESNEIISRNIVSYIPESGHYIEWKYEYKFEYDAIYSHEWKSEPYVKYGILAPDMTPVINCIYDAISTYPNEGFIFRNDPESIFGKALHETPTRTRYYFVNNSNLKGLYTESGKCIMEPRYDKIKSKDYKNFIAESKQSICIYSEEDGFVRLLAQHHVNQYGPSKNMTYIEKKFSVIESKPLDRYFIGYNDPDTGKTGLIDDRLNIILDPIYDSIDYNHESFTAWKGNTSKRYFWDQYIKDNNIFRKLNLNDFPIENMDEINNRDLLQSSPKTILFIDTETNGLPKDYNASPQDTDNWPRVLQVSWIITDEIGNVLKKRNYFIRPEGFMVIKKSINNPYAIPESILLEKGVNIKYVLEELSEDINDIDLIVGHNIKFDKSVIQAEVCRLSKTDIFVDKQIFCTMLAGKRICEILSKHGFKYPKLQELYQKLLNKKIEGAHDALNDVEATIECFFKIWKG